MSMNNLNVKQKSVISIIVIMLISSYPFVFDRLFALPDKNIIYIIGVVGLLLISNAFSGLSQIPRTIIICVFIQMIIWLLFFVIHNDPTYITRIFFLLIVLIMLAAICDTKTLASFVQCNNVMIAIQSIGALVAFVLVAVGILSPLITTTNIDGRPLYFLGFSCTNIYLGNIMRPSGFFDEPGALAFWGIFALIFNKLYYDNKRIEHILIIGLLSTLSLAYYIQLALYVVCFYTSNFKKNAFVILVIVAAVFFVNKLGPNSELYNSTFGRFQLNEEGQFRSSRYRLMDIAKDEFHKHPIWGEGASQINELEYMGDNPYENLATDGIVGTITIYLPLLMVFARCRNNKKFVFSFLIIAIGYLQRPFHVNLMHYFMLYLFVLLSLNLVNNEYD